ncbi:hypothetical protein NW768_006864 [Fusarium equiseti]|uniref:Uncharacterized protein n=1 Tax=Fusarium equiseti TaxID=61235 RepID=A0ABQ8R9L3_FUSEQ|nr:hypothetical protein NW768_006864 [Fusarium equiseti]
MASLCNYTHPDFQITEGLVRQDTGILFPYNPEFYDTATGLYGPGAIYCWYMLLASVLATWFYGYANEKKPNLSSDLVGALAYPAFAATDLLIQSIRMIGIKDRAIAISCLAFDSSGAPGEHRFSTEPLDMKDIPPRYLTWGSVSLIFLDLARLHNIPAPKLRNMPPCYLVIFATLGYICLSLAVFYFSLGDFGEAYLLVLLEGFNQVILMETCILTALLLAVIPQSIFSFISAWRKGKDVSAQEAINNMKDGALVMVILIVPSMVMIFYLEMSNIPDLAIRITERDQLATLIVGIVTLIYTILDLLDMIPVPVEVGVPEEATEMLPPQNVQTDYVYSPVGPL